MSSTDPAEQVLSLLHRRGNNSVNALGSVTGTVTLENPGATQTNSEPATFNTLTAGGNLTVNLPPAEAGRELFLLVTQDGTGSRLVTWANPSGSVVWVGAAAPTLTTTAAHADLLKFVCLDGTNYIGSVQLNVH